MLTFNADTHEYFDEDGKFVPNVTRVLGALNPYLGVPQEVLDAKADIGDAVHYACELYDLGQLEIWPKEIDGYMKAYEKFRLTTGFNPTVIERIVHHTKYKFCGRLDRVGMFSKLKRARKTDTCQIDIKTTALLMPTTGPQTAAYNEACASSFGFRPKRRFAVQLKPSGDYVLEEYADPGDFGVFLSALNLYNWKLKHNIKGSP